MDNIQDVTVSPCMNSKYIKPFSMQFSQNGIKKKWDIGTTHDGVAVLLYHVGRKAFIFVKQFRPAVYMGQVTVGPDSTVDTQVYHSSLGITHELCAGIMDKNTTPAMTARDEIFEECGYRVPLDHIQRITSYRTCVGTSGAKMTLFYAEVTDSMKENRGGGLEAEGEFIEVVEVGVEKSRAFLMDESINKPVGLMFGLMWFYENKYPDT